MLVMFLMALYALDELRTPKLVREVRNITREVLEAMKQDQLANVI